MTFAIASDVETEIGRPAITAAETAQWTMWLERVERAITRRFTREGYDLQEQVNLGAPSVGDLIDIEVTAVARKIENPTGVTSVTQSIDDASVTTRRDGAASGGDPLALTDDEWTALLPAKSKRARAFSVMPS